MKPIFLFLLSLFLLTGCQVNDEPEVYQETGVVVNYAGAEHCSIVIQLDNGQVILPLYYPSEFIFTQGQRLQLSYTELPNVLSTCGKGIASDILHVEEISCGSPLTGISLNEYNLLPNDPVFIHSAFIEGECLNLKVSFSGGCRNHLFNLVKIQEEQPGGNTAVVELRHDANGDVCEAILTSEMQFSLTDLKSAGYNYILFNALLDNGETYKELFELEQ